MFEIPGASSVRNLLGDICRENYRAAPNAADSGVLDHGDDEHAINIKWITDI